MNDVDITPLTDGSSARESRLQRGVSHLQRGDVDGAIEELTGILRFDSRHPVALQHRAEAYRLAGDYECALADYEVASQLAPNDPRLRFQRGQLRLRLGQAERAVEDFTACIDLDPNHALAYAKRGAAHAACNEYETALADFASALARDPACTFAYQQRAELLASAGRFDQAATDFAHVLRLNPYCARTYLQRGDLYRQMGHHRRAIADYTNAVRLDPLNVQCHVRRASSYTAVGRHDLALADLTRAAQLAPEDALVYLQRALAHRALGNVKETLADLEIALARRPNDPTVIHERGRTFETLGDTERALGDYDAALRSDPAFAAAYDSRGSLHVSRGDVDRGLADFAAALRCDPGLTLAALHRASAWMRKGRFDKAVEDCDAVIARDPELAEAALLRASALVGQGDYGAASAELDRLASIDSDNARACHIRGSIALKQGRYESAVADFTAALLRTPDDARTLYSRGCAYQFLERHDEALTDLHQAVLRDPRYTADYCNQRAWLHASAGDYEMALADYAIVLQLDPLNVTALAGREEALQARASQPAVDEPSASARVGSAKGATPRTQVMSRQRGTATHGTVDQPEITAEAEPATGGDASEDFVLVPGGLDASDSTGDFELTASDVEPAPESMAQAAAEPTSAVGNPFHARLERDKQQTELSERARLWAEMRHRERRANLVREMEASAPAKASRERSPWVGRILKIAVAAAVLLVAGGGLFYWLSHRDLTATSEEAWQEYAQDNARAVEKYRGKFVQIAGKVTVLADGKTTRLFFDPPKDAKWRIEFLLRPGDLQGVKSGQEIVVRGRFAPRKNPDTNLTLSNCSLIERH